MRAFKFLRPGAVAPFSGRARPVPRGGEPGAWVEAAGPLDPCRNGVHVCRAADLACWMTEELWEVETDGEAADGPDALVVARARLVRRIDAWRDGAAAELAADCAVRARAAAAARAGTPSARIAATLAGDVESCAAARSFVVAAYVTGVLFGTLARDDGRDPVAAVAAERAVQSALIARRLGLADESVAR